VHLFRALSRVSRALEGFDDQSTMKVKTAGIADIFPPVGKIKAIQEESTEFTLQFEDGSSMACELPAREPRWRFVTRITE
jgi:hypothetical protein